MATSEQWMARKNGELMPTGSFESRVDAAKWIEQGVVSNAWRDKGWRELPNGDIERRADEDNTDVLYSVTRSELLPSMIVRG